MSRGLLWAFAFLFSTQALALVKDDCNESLSSKFVVESEVSGVSCAIEKFTGKRPSEKYLFWVLFNAHQYYKNTEAVTGESKKMLLKRFVIQQFQAYGFCDVNAYGHMEPGWSQFLRKIIPEKAVTNKDELEKFSELFGYNEEPTMQKIAFWKDWTKSSPAQRQSRFLEFIDTGVVNDTRKPATFGNSGPNFYAGKFGDNLKACHAQMRSRYEAPNSPFNLKTGSAENMELCRLMMEDSGFDVSSESSVAEICGGKTISIPMPASGGGSSNKTIKPVNPSAPVNKTAPRGTN